MGRARSGAGAAPVAEAGASGTGRAQAVNAVYTPSANASAVRLRRGRFVTAGVLATSGRQASSANASSIRTACSALCTRIEPTAGLALARRPA